VIFALVLVLLLLAIASLAIDAYYRSRASRPAAPDQPPAAPATSQVLAALDARYARGEVSREDYLRTQDDLRGTADATTQVIPPNPEPNAA
jgi:uncharacterized membrane protein